MKQSTLFENKSPAASADGERLTLFALGEFQARGKDLVNRELPLDRLRGALRRAAEVLGFEEPGDDAAVASFAALGARVRRVPAFVAKHPFRVTVAQELADRALKFYEDNSPQKKSDAESDVAGDD